MIGLPWHGQPIYDLTAHAQRLDVQFAAVIDALAVRWQGAAVTAAEVAADSLISTDNFVQQFAFYDSLSMLQYLESQGRASRPAGHIDRFEIE